MTLLQTLLKCESAERFEFEKIVGECLNLRELDVLLFNMDRQAKLYQHDKLSLEQQEFEKMLDRQNENLTQTIKSKIFKQFEEIYRKYKKMNFDDEMVEIPKVDLSFLGINKKYNPIDLTFYGKYRETLFNYIKIGLAFYTLFKVVKILKNMGGGNK